MAYYIPVIFSCLINGSCGFLYGDVSFTEKDCLAEVRAMREEIHARPEVQNHFGTCIPLQAV